MKTLALLTITLLMFATMSTLVLAYENETNDSQNERSQELMPNWPTESNDSHLEMDAGIGPKSRWYWFDNMGDRIRFAFAFGNEAKAQKALEIAEEKLAEIEALEDADPELVEKARARYERYIERATSHMEKIEARNEEKAGNALGKVATMQERLELHYNKSLAKKERILKRHEENMTEEQLARLEAAFGKLENKTERARERLGKKENRVREIYQLKTNATDEEIDALMEEAKQAYKTKIEERTYKSNKGERVYGNNPKSRPKPENQS